MKIAVVHSQSGHVAMEFDNLPEFVQSFQNGIMEGFHFTFLGHNIKMSEYIEDERARVQFVYVDNKMVGSVPAHGDVMHNALSKVIDYLDQHN